MKTQLTPRGLLRVILCILVLGCHAQAGQIFLDDFSDGDIQDDTPVTWQWNADGGQCQVTPDGLQFRPSQSTPHSPGTWLWASAQKDGTDVQVAGNVSIRAQLNIGSGDKARGCVGLRNSEPSGGYGSVDMKDLLKMIGCWGQDDASVDLVPDGVVDEKDLEILMDHWQEDVNEATLLAHWALDETEGIIAYDSVGFTDAALLGGPTWELDGGAIDGALHLDGQDDCLVVDSTLNPADGPFSILAWVKGGAAGQTIVSQADGENWLCADPATGCLMTGLKGVGRDSSSLCSEAVITDGNWHRVGLACDGENRALYVDDVLVAEDSQAGGLADCSGGLNIGCGKDMAPGTFFAGLIDDVRIYNRTVKP